MFPLSARQGANGAAWRDIAVHARQLRVHRYLSTSLHNAEHIGSQCSRPLLEPGYDIRTAQEFYWVTAICGLR